MLRSNATFAPRRVSPLCFYSLLHRLTARNHTLSLRIFFSLSQRLAAIETHAPLRMSQVGPLREPPCGQHTPAALGLGVAGGGHHAATRRVSPSTPSFRRATARRCATVLPPGDAFNNIAAPRPFHASERAFPRLVFTSCRPAAPVFRHPVPLSVAAPRRLRVPYPAASLFCPVSPAFRSPCRRLSPGNSAPCRRCLPGRVAALHLTVPPAFAGTRRRFCRAISLRVAALHPIVPPSST